MGAIKKGILGQTVAIQRINSGKVCKFNKTESQVKAAKKLSNF